MTKYTDIHGNQVVVCDHCRADIPHGEPTFSLSPGKAADGYVLRDYERGETILCASCAKTLGQVLTIMGVKRAADLVIEKEAA
ncbi:MAG: hypothetical protein FDZ69_00120 [Deltaproteobacteria bacterium]|nr:MAG: hypothetical protein FDZ69_00120 [Deltaproteobacteria bacterium]